ncbi:MAG: hypothetical protein VB074_00705 [Proteiniphilum sp.]|uniref:hypothetical protein n=1 Tax=Proteiniphilum sp. TaxID=1926877 RepID=UPI00092CB814|nr:hypothetical protein [Proteiniphilum sp.]MEA5126681.1 hypothetical protein [Proteiniphilum sp.]OJV88553.1 MAG: hypothetical protein BGO34_18180 [Bacteroidia bacterium 44-10]
MDNNNKKGISRRESLQIGTGIMAGVVFPGMGIRVFAEKKKNNYPVLFAPVRNAFPMKPLEDWVQDILVVSMPAAAVGGKNAGVYTAGENGITPWNSSIIRWLTSKSVRGNGAVLVRQEAPNSGVGVSAIVDPFSEYNFEVLIYLPGDTYFGTNQEDLMQVWVAALDSTNNNILAEQQVDIVKGEWSTGRLFFSSESSRMVNCIVYAKSIKNFPCMYYVDSFQLTRNDYVWWNPENYFNNSRTVNRLKDNRQALIDKLDPDAVAGHNGIYLNWDGFYTDKGILVGGGNWEQEYNHISIHDPVLAEFEDNGIARDIDGEKIKTHPLWPGFQMCHNAPAYHDYFLKRVTRIAPEVSIFTQDNINMPSFQGWGKGCFCKWCRIKFKDWLKENKNLGIVKKTKITDFSSFDIAEYVDEVKTIVSGKGDDVILADPILKSYLLFQYDSQLKLWKESVDKIKLSANHPIIVMGNQYGNNGEKPYSVALSQIGDVVCTESNIGTNHKMDGFDRIKALLLIKLGLAAGEFKRPVWLQYSSLFHSPVAAKSRLRFVWSQSLANNGIPFTWATTIGQSGWFFDIEAEICQFIQQYRYLFSHNEGYATVGLVYSLPTHLWRKYNAFDLSPKKQLKSFYSFAKLLEDMHIPYEVNCWWHPLLGDDEVSFERLSRYKLLILPEVDCFTNEQLNTLSLFQKRGGKIINMECPATYDQDVEPLPANLISGIRSQFVNVEPALLRNYEIFQKEMSQQISKFLGTDMIVETDAPAHVWSSLQLSETGKILSLHLVNGHINESEDRFYPVRSTKWKIRLPEGLHVKKAKLIRIEVQKEENQIPVEIKNGWATISVPLIEGYTIIALYSGDALSEAERDTKKRRAELMRVRF